MKSVEIVVVLGFISILSVTNLYADTPWEAYIHLPNSKNASRVEEIKFSREIDETERLTQIETDLFVLENQVMAGDVEAIDLAFRLRSKSD